MDVVVWGRTARKLYNLFDVGKQYTVEYCKSRGSNPQYSKIAGPQSLVITDNTNISKRKKELYFYFYYFSQFYF